MIKNLQIYCLARPHENFPPIESGIIRILCAYRAGRGGSLLSLPVGGMLRGGLMGLDDRGLDPTDFDSERFACRAVAECALRGYEGIYAELSCEDLASRVVPELERHLIRRRGRLYLCENAAPFAKSGRVVINSDVTGGSFSGFLAEKCGAYGAGRLALGLSHMRLDYTIPAADPSGMRINDITLTRLLKQSGAQVFFSDELCSNYFTYTDSSGSQHFTLFDNRRSMLKKMIMARDAGIAEVFISAVDLPGVM